MKFRPLFGLVATAFVFPVYAQDPAPPAPATQTPAAKPAPSKSAVSDALGKKDTDVDQSELLKMTLTAVDKDYSLLKRGSHSLTYGLNYAYSGKDRIIRDATNGAFSTVVNEDSHAMTNTFSLDYGLRDNLTLNLTVPVVSKFGQGEKFTGVANAIGDITIGARFQPFGVSRDSASLTFSSSLRLPTGTSPFKIIENTGLATGSGTAAITGGINVSKVVDPVALFGSFGITYSLPATNVNQYSAASASTLTYVKPGYSISFGGGFAYALSYAITTNISFQESIATGTFLRFRDANGDYSDARTSTQASGILSLGLGYRVSPKTTINTSVGIGLTANAPNFSLDMSLPLQF
jgi:hypothetical protein